MTATTMQPAPGHGGSGPAPCPDCAATGAVDPTPEQVRAYRLLPGTRLRCGSCAGAGTLTPAVAPAA